MPTDQKIDYIELPAADFDAVEAFYSHTFGWDVHRFWPAVSSLLGSEAGGGFYKSDLCSRTETEAALVILYATDLEETRDRVLTHGGHICQEIFSFPGGRRFHFLDPTATSWRSGQISNDVFTVLRIKSLQAVERSRSRLKRR
jgi:predicted enzyme related to lactoylglutathione lyase